MQAKNAYSGRGLHGQVVEQIGAGIIDGSFAPGTLLLADALEREFEVSLTVVREALKVLAAKGLVESRQKRGTVVRPRDQWSLLDPDVLRWQNAAAPDFAFLDNLAEMRAIIEPAAARLAAQRRTDDDLAALDDALSAMSIAGSDIDALVSADVRFHCALVDAAHNELLSQMKVVLEAGLTVRDQFVHRSTKQSDAVTPHRELFDAIKAGDPDLAASTIEALLTTASADLQAARRSARRRRAK